MKQVCGCGEILYYHFVKRSFGSVDTMTWRIEKADRLTDASDFQENSPSDSGKKEIDISLVKYGAV